MVFHKKTAKTLGKIAFFAIKAKKGPIRTTFKTQCKKHQKHSVKWPFLKKCFIPFVKKGLFFELFSKCFQNTAFLIDKTRKKRCFWQTQKSQSPKKAILPSFFACFLSMMFFRAFWRDLTKKSHFPECFCWFFQGHVPKRFFEKVEKLEVFCLFFFGGWAPSSTGKYNKGVSRPGGGVLGEGVSSLRRFYDKL